MRRAETPFLVILVVGLIAVLVAWLIITSRPRPTVVNPPTVPPTETVTWTPNPPTLTATSTSTETFLPPTPTDTATRSPTPTSTSEPTSTATPTLTNVPTKTPTPPMALPTAGDRRNEYLPLLLFIGFGYLILGVLLWGDDSRY